MKKNKSDNIIKKLNEVDSTINTIIKVLSFLKLLQSFKPKDKKVVYCFNYNNLIFVYRHDDGTWAYSYSMVKFINYFDNKESKESILINIGLLLTNVMEFCIKSYGDPTTEFDPHTIKTKHIKEETTNVELLDPFLYNMINSQLIKF